MKEDMMMRTNVMSSSRVISYWVTTMVTALELLAGGVTDLIHGRTALVAGEPVALVLAHLGYPVYLLTILGVWKLLGAIALLAPSLCTRVRLHRTWYVASMTRARSSGHPSSSSFSHLLRGRFDRKAVPSASSFPQSRSPDRPPVADRDSRARCPHPARPGGRALSRDRAPPRSPRHPARHTYWQTPTRCLVGAVA